MQLPSPTEGSRTGVSFRVPGAVQRRLAMRRRTGTHDATHITDGPQLCSAPLRAALRPGHETRAIDSSPSPRLTARQAGKTRR